MFHNKIYDASTCTVEKLTRILTSWKTNYKDIIQFKLVNEVRFVLKGINGKCNSFVKPQYVILKAF